MLHKTQPASEHEALMNVSQEFVDEYHNIHRKGKILGQGGQGTVFRTEDPDLVIKLVTINADEAIDLQKYVKRFKSVRLLPLPEKNHISVPIACLQDRAGYVMHLLDEMRPFEEFWLSPENEKTMTAEHIPAWLSAVDEKAAKSIVHYYQSGGLRRRLRALAKCAAELVRLHAHGLVYGDISNNNVFISKDLDNYSVWLIDADNIRFEVSTGGSSVYTPKYGAPELVQGKDGIRPSSDCYSFAVLAFYILSLLHPFHGKKVDGTDDADNDWADESNDEGDNEAKADAGHFPWVDDANDDSNASHNGLPRVLILTEKLKMLFEGTFGAGRTAPFKRPVIYHWPQALVEAADSTILCPTCHMHYYHDCVHPETQGHHCPYCRSPRPTFLLVQSHRWHGSHMPLSAPCWQYVQECPQNSRITLPKRLFTDFSVRDFDTAELLFSLTENAVLLEKAENSTVEISIATEQHAKGCFQKLHAHVSIACGDVQQGFWLLAHSAQTRVLSCHMVGGA